MPEQTFLPYAYAGDALEISIDSLRLDEKDKDFKGLVNADQGQLSLAGEEDWSSARIHLSVTDPNDELSTVLLEGEKPGSAVAVYAVLRSADARRRTALPLEKHDGAWRGSFDLRRSDYRGAASLEAVGVRGLDGRREEGLAWRKGERIVASDRWTIYLDDRPFMPGGAIDGEWSDFRLDSREVLRDRKDCVSYLDLSNPDRPKLFLNEGIDGLRAALETGQQTGRVASVRDALAQSLLQPVILAMAIDAIDGSRQTTFDELAGWRRKLLLHLAQRCDGRTEEATVEEWLAAWKAGDRVDTLADLSTAIQRHLEAGKSATKLVRALEAQRDG